MHSLTNTAMNVDYMPMATPSVLTFAADSPVTNDPTTSSFLCFTVPITDDNDVESNENFMLGLTSPTGLIVVDANRPDSTAVATIIDNDRKL